MASFKGIEITFGMVLNNMSAPTPSSFDNPKIIPGSSLKITHRKKADAPMTVPAKNAVVFDIPVVDWD
jgi:hypothetical protein